MGLEELFANREEVKDPPINEQKKKLDAYLKKSAGYTCPFNVGDLVKAKPSAKLKYPRKDSLAIIVKVIDQPTEEVVEGQMVKRADCVFAAFVDGKEIYSYGCDSRDLELVK